MAVLSHRRLASDTLATVIHFAVQVKMLRHEHLLHMSEVFLFLKEFKTIKHMRHENIVQFIGIGGVQDDEGRVVELFIVQEMCRGGTLRKVVQVGCLLRVQ